MMKSKTPGSGQYISIKENGQNKDMPTCRSDNTSNLLQDVNFHVLKNDNNDLL